MAFDAAIRAGGAMSSAGGDDDVPPLLSAPRTFDGTVEFEVSFDDVDVEVEEVLVLPDISVCIVFQLIRAH